MISNLQSDKTSVRDISRLFLPKVSIEPAFSVISNHARKTQSSLGGFFFTFQGKSAVDSPIWMILTYRKDGDMANGFAWTACGMKYGRPSFALLLALHR